MNSTSHLRRSRLQRGFGAVLLFVAGMVCLGTASASRGASPAADEYAIKAALVLNFARFATWPEHVFARPQSPVNFCILGDEFLAGSFAALEAKTIGQRPVKVSIANRLKDPDACHLIFISGADRQGLSRVLAAIADRPVLTIGEMTTFTALGGMINLMTIDGRLKFSVNSANTRRAGLMLSSRVLKLADTVEDGGVGP